MLNREFKRELIENGKADGYRRKRSDLIKNNDFDIVNEAQTDDYTATEVFGMWPEEIRESERIRKNAQRQRQKIEDHLEFLMNGNWDLFFITLTFTDECLRTTKDKTRKTTITRLLSSFCDDYILNIDYGTENEREHYHGVIAILRSRKNVTTDDDGHIRIDELDRGYRYGFYNVQKISREDRDRARIAKYVTKLTMHSIKVKQTYVSVKKNTPYQKFKELNVRFRSGMRNDQRQFWGDYEENEVWLLSGYATDFDA